MARFLVVSTAVLFALTSVPVWASDEKEAAASEPSVKVLSARERRDETLDTLLASLRQAQGEGEAKRVETRIRQLWATTDSPTAEALLGQASAALNKFDLDASLHILNETIDAYPGFAEAWNRRAALYFSQGKYDQSLADIDKALELEPRHFGALAARGMILQKQQKYGAAAEAYKDALAVNPNLTSAKEALKALERLEAPI
jgi:tetratricopeptide (TPR) repeat protein